MKKLLLVLLIGVMSLTAFSAGFEVRGGMDTGSEDSDTNESDTTTIGAGYVVKAEYLFGEGYEYGVGVGYRQFGDTSSDDSNYDGKTYMTSILLYGTGKFNFGDPGFSPYLRANAGYAMNTAGDYFEDIETLYQAYDSDLSLELTGGLYWGVGLGLEYNSFLVELVYESITTAVTIDSSLAALDGITTFNANTISLELGYKFGTGN